MKFSWLTSPGETFLHDPKFSPSLRKWSRETSCFSSRPRAFLPGETAFGLKELGIGIPHPPPHLKRDIQVSVDSPDPEIAAMLTRNARYLANAVRTVKNLVAAGLAPRVKCVLTSCNFDAPEGLVRLFTGLGVRNFQFVQYGRSYYRHSDALFLTYEQKVHIKKAMRGAGGTPFGVHHRTG